MNPVSSRYRALIVALVCLFAFSGASVAMAAPPQGKGNQAGPGCTVEGGATVVLDPGHGGSDPGTSYPDLGLVEKDVNLQIAIAAADYLSGMGYSVALTRSGDEDLGNSERGDIANACGALVFVEIHLNGSSDSSVDYSQTFWGKRRKDEDFAIAMAGALRDYLYPLTSNGTWQFANGGLLQATMPSTLVEAAFLTNDDEAALFAAGSRQDEIASAIANGINDWFASQGQ